MFRCCWPLVVCPLAVSCADAMRGENAASRDSRNTDLHGMKWLIAFAAVVVLGLAGVVVTHEMRSSSSASGSNQKIATISTGERVELAPHLRAGTWTVVEFTAEW